MWSERPRPLLATANNATINLTLPGANAALQIVARKASRGSGRMSAYKLRRRTIEAPSRNGI